MSGLRWFDREGRQAFAACGVRSVGDLVALGQGEVVSRARTRLVRRIELSGQVFFVKVQDLRGAALPLRKWPSYALRGSPVGREMRSLRLLAGQGFATPQLVAGGEEPGLLLPRAAVLVTRELGGRVDLVRFLASGPDRRRAAAAIGAAEDLVRRVHAAGLVLLGAKYRNILLPAAGAEDWSELALIDQPDLRRSRSRRLRAKDDRHMRADRARYGPGG